MKKSLSLIRPVMFILTLIFLLPIFAECNNNRSHAFPEGFANKTDTEKIIFLMEKVGPDSVARFIGYSALYRNDSLRRIKDFPEAVRFAYIGYKDQDRISFSDALQKFTDSIPLEERLYIFKLSSPDNLDRLGFMLGREYIEKEISNSELLDETRIENMEVIKVFRKICSNDSSSFKSFLRGFKLAVKSPQDLLNEP